LQLQNNSAFGVDVDSEAYSCIALRTFKEFGDLTSAIRNSNLRNSYVHAVFGKYLFTAVESNLRTS